MLHRWINGGEISSKSVLCCMLFSKWYKSWDNSTKKQGNSHYSFDSRWKFTELLRTLKHQVCVKPEAKTTWMSCKAKVSKSTLRVIQFHAFHRLIFNFNCCQNFLTNASIQKSMRDQVIFKLCSKEFLKASISFSQYQRKLYYRNFFPCWFALNKKQKKTDSPVLFSLQMLLMSICFQLSPKLERQKLVSPS